MSASAVLADELCRAFRAYVPAAAAPASGGQRTTPHPNAQPPAPVGALRVAAAVATHPAAGLVDIGANLLDPMFQGEYREKPRHPPDLPAVLRRARAAGVGQIMITAGSLQESRDALALARGGGEGWPELLCTVGVHPTRCGEFEGGPLQHLDALLEVGRQALDQTAGGTRCVAVGECGLDYDRLQFCPKDVQLRFFELQLTGLAAALSLPLFLHCRTADAAADLLKLLAAHLDKLPDPPGVVHSFDGRLEDAQGFIALGFYIGLNGCSLRTAENLEVVKQLPSDRLLLETDAPWCSTKATHAGFRFVRTTWEEVKKPERWEEGKCVKDRCEPCHLRQVLEVIAGCRGEEAEALAAQTIANAHRVFLNVRARPVADQR